MPFGLFVDGEFGHWGDVIVAPVGENGKELNIFLNRMIGQLITIWAFFEVCGEDFRPKYKWVKYLSFLGHFLIVIGDLLLKPAGHHVSSFNKATYQFLLIFALANIMQVPILNI